MPKEKPVEALETENVGADEDARIQISSLHDEIVGLAPALFLARREGDGSIGAFVDQEIIGFELNGEILALLNDDSLSEELRNVLFNARAALAAAIAGSFMVNALTGQCERLKELASKDKNTGLWNQNAFMEYVANLFEDKKSITMFSFVFADIDHFKVVNDTYGHDAGDFVLKEVGLIIKETMRVFDVGAKISEKKTGVEAYRIGGEEFGFILHGTDANGAYSFAERLRRNIAEHQFVYEGKTIDVTMSFGVTEYVKEADKSFDTMKKRGDEALYESKNNGRNQVNIKNIKFWMKKRFKMMEICSF